MIKRIFIALLILVAFFFSWHSILPRLLLIGKQTDHKVHVAFGFHGNLYHSFRIDTNDEAGFGKDIRLIRHIIDVLDRKNAEGVPVKGVWDIENLFSLEEQIPAHAPDIIENLQRRVRENGDEVILMSYNNGLASALTEKEFDDTVARGISNPQGSGIADLFDSWGKFVRPQEMMTTPGNFQRYQHHGITGIALYYSSITFDAFRVFSRKLTRTEAHNPLTYVNDETGEKMLLIPTYNHADLSENISLREWIEELHRLQRRGKIDRDVLLFINADADAEYWNGFDFPPYLAWLPNTGGLEQLVDSIKDLEYVEFTTLTEYTDTHKPVGEVSFGQDTADGSFNGYVSWSEKAYSHDYWKNVTDDRRVHDIIPRLYAALGTALPALSERELRQSYEKRLRLQSTTNFGMATPFLARGRERVVEKIIKEMNSHSHAVRTRAEDAARRYLAGKGTPSVDGYEFVESMMLIHSSEKVSTDGEFITLLLSDSYLQNHEFILRSAGGDRWPLSLIYSEKSNGNKTARYRFYVPVSDGLSDGVYTLHARPTDTTQGKSKAEATAKVLRNTAVEIGINDNGTITGVTADGVEQLEKGSLLPMIQYDGKVIRPQSLKVTPSSNGEAASVNITGEITLPVEGADAGELNYHVSLVEDLPVLLVEGTIIWPDTPRHEIYKPNLPSLSRKYDPAWIETAPVELIFSHTATRDVPFKVLKRNYMDVESSYLIDYFRHSSDNLNLANVNNHITAEYVALAGSERGIAVAMDTSVLSNFAFCPMKIDYRGSKGFHARLNPFGTYFGKQYYQPTWGNGQGFKVAILSGDQYETAACTYSGYTSRFSLMITFFEGRDMPEDVKNQLISFAHPPMVITSKNREFIDAPRPFKAPKGFMATADKEGVYFHWEKPGGPHDAYTIYCGTETGKYDATYRAHGTETSKYLKEFVKGTAFDPNTTYYARITSIDANGKESEKSEEIVFVPEPRSGIFGSVNLPMTLQLKILFSTILSMID